MPLHSPAQRVAAAAIPALLPRFKAPVGWLEHAGLIDLHNGGHNQPAQHKHPDRITDMLSEALISKAQAAIHVDTIPLHRIGI